MFYWTVLLDFVNVFINVVRQAFIVAFILCVSHFHGDKWLILQTYKYLK